MVVAFINPKGWAIFRKPRTGIWVTPIDGWGFLENVDGKLAIPFEIVLDASGIDFGDGIKGWRAHLLSDNHKYSGMSVKLTPRHTRWDGVTVVTVTNGDLLVFSGMADTEGLECNW